MGLASGRPLPFLDPQQLGQDGPCPPLGLLRADVWRAADLIALKQRQSRPVQVIFPVKDGSEAANLAELAAILDPLAGTLIDAGWLACGAHEPGDLALLPRQFPWLRLFLARQAPPPDQVGFPWGKGAVMRALLHHLVRSREITNPRAILQFFDADIRPAYFGLQWCLGPVGALLWFTELAAAKVVYFRPRGGRLNTFVRSLLAALPHAGVQRLQELLYLLSGEMAATLTFWTTVPFKTGYGIEILILLALALDQLQLRPDRPDLAALVQVFVGQMDHRHAPLRSDRWRAGLDQMAATVCHTLLEVLGQAGVLTWTAPTPTTGPLHIPLPTRAPAQPPAWLTVPVGEATLPPLRSLPEIAAALSGEG
ncbi:MAG: hypothetical protein ACUVRZ_10170 [Desulfobacca sp.]|uniref:hypothetical protein n=1 Tax=Desulfobacca sp. TaxID=2067990 RepID=UPI00404900BF